MSNQKLELTWIGKDERPRLEPRILLEDTERSYAAAERVSENDIFDDRLIFGDNLPKPIFGRWRQVRRLITGSILRRSSSKDPIRVDLYSSQLRRGGK